MQMPNGHVFGQVICCYAAISTRRLLAVLSTARGTACLALFLHLLLLALSNPSFSAGLRPRGSQERICKVRSQVQPDFLLPAMQDIWPHLAIDTHTSPVHHSQERCGIARVRPTGEGAPTNCCCQPASHGPSFVTTDENRNSAAPGALPIPSPGQSFAHRGFIGRRPNST